MSDELDMPVLDGHGRIHGSASVCQTSFQVWDDAVRIRRADVLLQEVHMASWPLAASSFWLPAGAAPRCALEALAASIFQLHAGDGLGHCYNASSSGAEWWANVSDSDALQRPEGQGGYGKVALHFDKDEAIYASAGLFVHPLLSTVTYLCDEGAPTLVVPGCLISTEGVYQPDQTSRAVPGGVCLGAAGGIGSATVSSHDAVCLVPPRAGRHLRFDGRWLHGAPEALGTTLAGRSYLRVTFLVNVWVGHRPGRCARFQPPWEQPPARPLGAADSGPGLKTITPEGLPFRFRLRRVIGATTARPVTVRSGVTRRTAKRRRAGRAVGECGGQPAGFEMPLEQTDEPHVLRLGLSAERLRGALHGGNVVIALSGRAGGAAGGTEAAAMVMKAGGA